ncbi:MAG TPA: hypothetical protein VGL72_21720, partial [Bryobacteraceae bacterium]
MRTRFWTVLFGVALAAVAVLSLFPQSRNNKSVEMPKAVAYLIRLGVGDAQATDWSGSIIASTGGVQSIQGWRFRGQDSTDGKTSWKAWSGKSLINVGRQNAGTPAPTLENGVLVGVSDETATFSVKTTQGEFSFAGSEIPIGTRKPYLDGHVVVDRVPDTVQLTRSPQDEDYPAMAQGDDSIYATYVQFVRGERTTAGWMNMGENAPKSFDFVARPVGGDQVLMIVYSKAKRVWSEPVPVTPPGQDILRTAVAIDGQKRVWVFYAANRKGDFGLFARSFAENRWSPEQRLSRAEGMDANPVAATDASGRVWVAWQAFRNNNLEILATAQNGDRFTPETVISFSKASDWDPSIAASSNGEVAIAWDTYDKGDYDVYFRRVKMAASGIQSESPVPVAASDRFEARSSIAYDRQNRLWVAYETSEAKWGKDQGALAKGGVPLYRNHSVAVKCFQGVNVFEPESDIRRVMPVAVTPQSLAAANRPNAKKKKAAPVNEDDTAGPNAARMRLNSFPRLAIDPSGVVYLTFRTRLFPGRTPEGSVWSEEMVYYDGAAWQGPLEMPNTDQWIDYRPAMAAVAPGDLMMLVVGDHRQAELLRDRRPESNRKDANNFISENFNADVYAAELFVKPAAQEARLKPAGAEKIAPPDPEVASENQRVAGMHGYRVSLGGEQLKVLRGEFHRHTDFSVDGQGDGPLIDAYRYMIDVAQMDWGACCDHDNGVNEYSWWIQQKLTDAYKLGDHYVAMFGHERSVSYPEGHRNAVFATRGIRPLPRLPKMANDSTGHAPDTLQLYDYLKKYDGIVASHTSGTDMGTDWRDNDPMVEPAVEIYQGCRQSYEMPDAPRSNSEANSIGGWRPLGFVSLALKKGYRLAFQASSDHGSTHISYCNLWVTKPTREGVLEAFKKRRLYGATDNIVADVRCGNHFMGEDFTIDTPPSIVVRLVGTGPFSKVHIIKDGEYVYSIEPGKQNVEFTWRDTNVTRGKTSYYYVRGEQQ